MEKRTAKNCAWAEPTLFLPLPFWVDAWNAPWTCRRDPAKRLIEDTRDCADCPRWEERRPPAPFGME